MVNLPGWYRIYPGSRIYPVNHPWEGDDLADVFGATDPGDSALQAQTETRVGNAAVAAQVQIPLERLYRQVVLFQSLNKQIIVVDTLAAADNLAIALRSEHVEGECQIGPLQVRLHIEGFDGCGIVMNHYRPVKAAGNDGFLVAAEVVAKLGGGAGLLERADSFLVGDAREGRLDVFELLDVALQDFKFARLVFHHTLDDGADQSFAEVHHVGEFGVGGFRLQHPEFGQVPAGFGFFSAGGRARGGNLAGRPGLGFNVKLAALPQMGLPSPSLLHLPRHTPAPPRPP